MDIKNRLLIKALAGCCAGMLISVFLCTFTSSYEDLNDRYFLLAQFIGSGIYGAVAMGGSVVYEIESWSVMRATLTHYLTVFVSFLIVNRLLGWFPGRVVIIAIITGTVVYSLIWLFEYAVWKLQVRELNEELDAIRLEDSGRTENL